MRLALTLLLVFLAIAGLTLLLWPGTVYEIAFLHRPHAVRQSPTPPHTDCLKQRFGTHGFLHHRSRLPASVREDGGRSF